MAFYKQDIADINLNTGSIFRSFLNHSIGFKNDDADRFGIRVFRDGEAVDLTGASCQAVFMRPDGTNLALTSYGTVSGNMAYVTLPQACYDSEGQFCLSIQLVGGGVTGTMRIVDGMVVNTGASGTVAPTASVPTYQEILSTYDAMVAATAAANGAIAATYSSSSTYAVGDYCIHDGGLYRCTTAITTGEAWTAAHWTATKIGPDVSALKSALTSFEKTGRVMYNATFEQGEITSQGVEQASSTAIRSGYIDYNTANVFSNVTGAQFFYIFEFNADGTFSRRVGWGKENAFIFATDGTKKYRVMVKKKNGADITPQENTFFSENADVFVNNALKGVITPQMFGVIADGIKDDTSAFASFVSYVESHDCTPIIPKGTYNCDVTLSVSNKRYVFSKHSVIKGCINFTNGCTGITLENVTVNTTSDYCLNIGANSNTLTFINCRFIGGRTDNYLIYNDVYTWGCKYINCEFIGTVNGLAVFNGILSVQANHPVNTSLLLIGCHFYNFQSIKEITGSYQANATVIIGGYMDSVRFIVRARSNASIRIICQGVDIEALDYAYVSNSYSNSWVSLIGCYGRFNYGIADTNTGFVNVNMAGFSFSADSPLFKGHMINPSSNIYVSLNGLQYDETSKYYLNASMSSQTLSVLVPPKSTVKALDTCYIVKLDRKTDVNTNIHFYSKSGELTHDADTAYNLGILTPLFIFNDNEEAKVVEYSVYTPNQLTIPIFGN